ncbi:hypothetical protein [Nostoc sp. MS1]|uniref:hypothetical protein n=1 Tax=Nostoc sp. MS1 TaxID=2764711 RepID=UPI001CC5E3AC|nr:hypothetical protein [Nostoc sp. MS1]
MSNRAILSFSIHVPGSSFLALSNAFGAKQHLTQPLVKILNRYTTLTTHRKPPYHLRQRHSLSIRRVHNLTRQSNHNPLLSSLLKPIFHA